MTTTPGRREAERLKKILLCNRNTNIYWVKTNGTPETEKVFVPLLCIQKINIPRLKTIVTPTEGTVMIITQEKRIQTAINWCTW